MGEAFRDWLTCPECGASDDVSTLAYKTEFSLECHVCGHSSEFAIGEEICLNSLDIDAITEIADKQTNE